MFILINYIQISLTAFNLNLKFIMTTFFYTCLTKMMWFLFSWVYLNILTVTPFNMTFGLQNNLSVIHPCLILGLYSLFSIQFSSFKSFFFKNMFYIATITMYFTLSLGGWWAYQEFNWGGWWNWDSIETPLFVFLIYISIVIFHTNSTTHKSRLWFKSSLQWAFIFLVFVISLPRIGQLNSVHSFILNNTTYNQYYGIFGSYRIICLAAFSIIKYVSIWTFSFIKSILVYAAVVSIFVVCNSKFRQWLNFAHIMFINISVYLLLINFKMLNIYIRDSQTIIIEWYSYKNFYSIDFMKFWTKPVTQIYIDLLYSLQLFLT